MTGGVREAAGVVGDGDVKILENEQVLEVMMTFDTRGMSDVRVGAKLSGEHDTVRMSEEGAN